LRFSKEVKGSEGMGVFSWFRNTWRKSQAAVVVENLLQSQASVGLFDGDPHHAANQLLEKV